MRLIGALKSIYPGSPPSTNSRRSLKCQINGPKVFKGVNLTLNSLK